MTTPRVSFSHVGFYVRDLPLMLDFYARVLGFVVTDRGEIDTPGGRISIAFLSRDANEHHQIVLATGRPSDSHFNVINQVSFRVDDLSALRHFHAALHREPVTEITPISHGNAISLYFRDPEGHRVELFMDTPWYCAQPCREVLDFSKSDEEVLAWTERLASALPGFKPRKEWSDELRRKLEA
jgi:catechol 2,3-dioxygenase